MGKTKRFACPEANLLPVTKFVGNGLLIKCLGQVDLPGAPLDIARRHMAPQTPSRTLPVLGCGNNFLEL